MTDPLDNVNEVMEGLEEATIHTSQGSFVRVEHVKRLLEDRKKAVQEDKKERLEGKKPPKTFDEARKQVREDEEIMKAFPSKGPQEPGHSVPATPQPSSRT